jgi:Flp pilus assembly protein TadG
LVTAFHGRLALFRNLGQHEDEEDELGIPFYPSLLLEKGGDDVSLMTVMGPGMRLRDRGNTGQAMVELVFVLLILSVLLLIIAQWGIIYSTQIALRDATMAGARYAALPTTSPPTDEQVRILTRNAAGATIADSDQVYVQVDRNVVVGGAGGATSVQATYPLTLILPYVVPGKSVGDTLTLTASTIMR